MSEIFISAQKQLQQTLRLIDSSVSSRSVECDLDVVRLNSLLSEATQSVNIMVLENMSSPHEANKTKIEIYQRTLRDFKKRTAALSFQVEQVYKNYPTRDSLNQRLVQATHMMAENIQISDQINLELASQTSKLEGALQKTSSIGMDLTRAHKLVNSIGWEMARNKRRLWAVASGLSLTALYIVYSYI